MCKDRSVIQDPIRNTLNMFHLISILTESSRPKTSTLLESSNINKSLFVNIS